MESSNNEINSESKKDMNQTKGSGALNSFSISIKKIFKEIGNEPVDLLVLLKSMDNMHGDDYGFSKLKNQKLK